MAILEGLPGLKVELHVGHDALVEYKPDVDEIRPNTVTKYVEATSDQKFSIHWNFDPSFQYKDDDIASRIYIDGVSTDVICVKRGTSTHKHAYIDGALMNEGGPWSRRPFKFSELVTSKYV